MIQHFQAGKKIAHAHPLVRPGASKPADEDEENKENEEKTVRTLVKLLLFYYWLKFNVSIQTDPLPSGSFTSVKTLFSLSSTL